MTAVLGVDPGVKGGVAVLRDDGAVRFVQPIRPTMTEVQLKDLMAEAVMMLYAFGGTIAFVERVGYIGARDGRKGDGGKGAFTFGKISGLLRGMLLAHGVTIRNADPGIWQAHLRCLTGGNKNISKAKAIELFPRIKITHAIADALLIAEYGRRVLGRDTS